MLKYWTKLCIKKIQYGCHSTNLDSTSVGKHHHYWSVLEQLTFWIYTSSGKAFCTGWEKVKREFPYRDRWCLNTHTQNPSLVWNSCSLQEQQHMTSASRTANKYWVSHCYTRGLKTSEYGVIKTSFEISFHNRCFSGLNFHTCNVHK